MKKIVNIINIIVSAVILCSCSGSTVNVESGTWMLTSIEYPNGTVQSYPVDGRTNVVMFDTDGTLYSFELATAGKETIIFPFKKDSYRKEGDTLVRGTGEQTYTLVEGKKLVVMNQVLKETYELAETITETRKQEIKDIINSVNQNEIPTQYILATTERQLRLELSLFQYLIICLIIVVASIVAYAYILRRNKREIERKLKVVESELELRPKQIGDTIRQLESEFFSSEYYLALRKKIENGDNLKDSDWTELDTKLKSIYTNFSTTLYGMFNLSQIEYQVCLLLKVKTTPTEIANVVNKDKSTISNIRRRLCKKVLGKDGSAKDWDEFIASL